MCVFRVFSEQSTSDLERVDLQYLPMKEIRNGVTFDDHRISPFERQQVIGANDISEQLTCGKLCAFYATVILYLVIPNFTIGLA